MPGTVVSIPEELRPDRAGESCDVWRELARALRPEMPLSSMADPATELFSFGKRV